MNLNLKTTAFLGSAVALLLAGLPSSRTAFAAEFDGALDRPVLVSPNLQQSPAPGNSDQSPEQPSEARVTPSPFINSAPRPAEPFPILLNKAVQAKVAEFLDQPDGLKLAFQRSRPFLPEMMRVMRNEGVPDDLVYLAFAESAFSKRGKGPWQFNRLTARRYGLRVDKSVDERRDPVLSTRAAAEYLADLHDQADEDWRVAVVGWNMGEAYLDRYWLLEGPNFNKFENKLPRRTRQLLNRFMAVDFIAHNAVAYGIGPVSFSGQRPYEMHRFRSGTPLATIARQYRTTPATLHSLNPALLTDRVPIGSGAYPIRLPLRMDERADASF